MKVVILCGVLGTRLKEETEYRPADYFTEIITFSGQPLLKRVIIKLLQIIRGSLE